MKKITMSTIAAMVMSSTLMAGGDIAPVAQVEANTTKTGWEFGGQLVGYYQTSDLRDSASLFDQEGSRGDVGIQLRASNIDIAYGIGAGFEVDGITTLQGENSFLVGGMQEVDGDPSGGWISQMYLTYAIDNTSVEAGRQELPKSLSPFAFSENWNVFRNTFDGVTVINKDLPDTTVVGAWVYGGNTNGIATDMSEFNGYNGNKGVWMLTVQNKSITDLALTGTWYFASEFGNDDLNILWGSADYKFGDYYTAGQVGTWMSNDFVADDSVAGGVKVGGSYDMFKGELAFSAVDDGGVQGVTTRNLGGVKTPLYTNMILNQRFIDFDSNTYVAKVSAETEYGTFGAGYGYSDMGDARVLGTGDFNEVDLTYKVAYNDVDLFAGYIYQDGSYDNAPDFTNNAVRFWARYNF